MARVRERLPVYMVPSDFVLLPRLPLNPNGKVDRRALAAIAPDETRRGGTPLQGELERRIAAVWREVLGIEEVGADDNFFDAGGHSLLLVRLHSRLEEALGRTIPLVELFGAPTVRSQAGLLARDAEPVRDRICFYQERPEVELELDGAVGVRPDTPWADAGWSSR